MQTKSPVRTVRELRRSQIVAAARTLVAEGGLESLTIGARESRLVFTRGVITYHFKDKDEIVLAVLDSVLAEIDSVTQAEASALSSFDDKVRAVIGAMTRGFLDHAEARTVLVSFWARIPSDKVVAERHAALFGTWRGQAEKLIRAGQASNAVRADVDPGALSALLVGIVLGIVVQAAFEEQIDAEALIDEAFATFWARMRRPRPVRTETPQT